MLRSLALILVAASLVAGSFDASADHPDRVVVHESMPVPVVSDGTKRFVEESRRLPGLGRPATGMGKVAVGDLATRIGDLGKTRSARWLAPSTR